MKLYKLKHLPTGLYFTPSRGSGNLSTKGKVYIDRIPDLKWIETIRIVIYTNVVSNKNKILMETFDIDTEMWRIDKYFKTDPTDWEIEELN